MLPSLFTFHGCCAFMWMARGLLSFCRHSSIVMPQCLLRSPKRRLDLARLVGGARLDDGLLAVPIPVEREARVRLRMDRILELPVPPVLAAVGRDLDPGDLAAAGPGDARDLRIAFGGHMETGRGTRDDGFRTELEVVPAHLAAEIGSGDGVVHRLVPRVVGLIDHLDVLQIFHAEGRFPAGRDHTDRETLLDPKRIAVLGVGDEGVVHGLAHRHRVTEIAGIAAFIDQPRAGGFDADFSQQHGQRDAGPFAAARHPVDVLHGRVPCSRCPDHGSRASCWRGTRGSARARPTAAASGPPP